MRLHCLLIPLLLLCSCRTTAGTKDKSGSAAQAARDEVLLQKIVGGLSNPKGPISDCTIKSSDVSDAKELKDLISKVPRSAPNVAYYIRAREPSLEVYAFDKGEKLVLIRDYSTREQRDDSVSQQLIQRINEKCPDLKP